MSDDMGEKFKQIAEMLGGQNSNVNIPENVKGLLNMLMSNSSTNDESPSEDDSNEKSNTDEETAKEETDEANDLTRKVKKAMNTLSPNDPKINLLNALNPYLNKHRQKKLKKCIKLIQMGSLARLFEDSDDK